MVQGLLILIIVFGYLAFGIIGSDYILRKFTGRGLW